MILYWFFNDKNLLANAQVSKHIPIMNYIWKIDTHEKKTTHILPLSNIHMFYENTRKWADYPIILPTWAITKKKKVGEFLYDNI